MPKSFIVVSDEGFVQFGMKLAGNFVYVEGFTIQNLLLFVIKQSYNARFFLKIFSSVN